MSIFDFKMEEKEETKKSTGTPWDIKVMLELYLSSNLTPRAIPTTLTGLHLQGHTGITESVLNKLRQLFLRLAEPNKPKVRENLQNLVAIMDTVIEEARTVDKDLAAKINHLLGNGFKISQSSLKTLEFLMRVGYCVNEDLKETPMEGVI